MTFVIPVRLDSEGKIRHLVSGRLRRESHVVGVDGVHWSRCGGINCTSCALGALVTRKESTETDQTARQIPG